MWSIPWKFFLFIFLGGEVSKEERQPFWSQVSGWSSRRFSCQGHFCLGFFPKKQQSLRMNMHFVQGQSVLMKWRARNYRKTTWCSHLPIIHDLLLKPARKYTHPGIVAWRFLRILLKLFFSIDYFTMSTELNGNIFERNLTFRKAVSRIGIANMTFILGVINQPQNSKSDVCIHIHKKNIYT